MKKKETRTYSHKVNAGLRVNLVVAENCSFRNLEIYSELFWNKWYILTELYNIVS